MDIINRCSQCKKKKMTTKCKYCDNLYCFHCVQLELHSCKNMNDSIEVEKNKILKSLKQNSNISYKSISYDNGNAY